ncbi:MAG TPA: NAD-binding protein, partial [Motiliproteus sp.]
GMQVNPLFVLDNLVVIVAVMVGLLLVKSLVLFAMLRLFSGTRTAIKSALLLAQCGEFSFVIFETAQLNNLFVSPERGQILVMAVVLTMMLTPFVFQHLDGLTARLTREPEGDEDVVGVSHSEQDPRPVVLCGFGSLGQRVAAKLEAAGVPYVAVEHDGSSFRSAKERGLPVYFGNAANRHFLEKIKVEHARAVVIAMSNEPRILLVAHAVRHMAAEVPIMVCASNAQLEAELQAIGVAKPIDSLDQSAEGLARQVIEGLQSEVRETA